MEKGTQYGRRHAQEAAGRHATVRYNYSFSFLVSLITIAISSDNMFILVNQVVDNKLYN